MKKVSKRLLKEVEGAKKAPPPGIRLINDRPDAKEGYVLEFEMEGAAGTLYAGETFGLRLICDAKYPFEPPATYFMIGEGRDFKVPIHEHIYVSFGLFICDS
jgi:ubiquitin-protein ligase